MKRRAARRDKTHGEVVDYLQGFGIAVEDMSLAGDGFPDLMTYKDEAVLIELKDELTSAVKFAQLRFMARWPGPCGFAVGKEQAYRLATDPRQYALTSRQRYRIQQLVDEFPDRDRIQLNVVLDRIR